VSQRGWKKKEPRGPHPGNDHHTHHEAEPRLLFGRLLRVCTQKRIGSQPGREGGNQHPDHAASQTTQPGSDSRHKKKGVKGAEGRRAVLKTQSEKKKNHGPHHWAELEGVGGEPTGTKREKKKKKKNTKHFFSRQRGKKILTGPFGPGGGDGVA